jgi:DNA-binding NtrC family response regulator
MPARIVLANDDSGFCDQAVSALRRAGHDVIAFTNSMNALIALEAAERVELLITRVRFPPGQPNGISLALVSRNVRPEIKIVFTALPEYEGLAAGIGQFIPMPVSIADLVGVVNGILAYSEPGRADTVQHAA